MMPLTLGQQAAQYAGNQGGAGPLGSPGPIGAGAGSNLIANALQGYASQPGVGFAGLGAPNRGPSLIAPPPSFPPSGAPAPLAPPPAPVSAPAGPTEDQRLAALKFQNPIKWQEQTGGQLPMFGTQR